MNRGRGYHVIKYRPSIDGTQCVNCSARGCLQRPGKVRIAFNVMYSLAHDVLLESMIVLHGPQGGMDQRGAGVLHPTTGAALICLEMSSVNKVYGLRLGLLVIRCADEYGPYGIQLYLTQFNLSYSRCSCCVMGALKIDRQVGNYIPVQSPLQTYMEGVAN